MGPREARAAEHDGLLASRRLYEQIGVGYARRRCPEPRIVAQLDAALGDARSVLNVGAGTGSYEPTGRRVVAVEPSPVMLAQRARSAAPAVQGVAEALPVPDRSFDAALAVLTLHHWTDPVHGLAELGRVARRQVVLHFEPGFPYWLTDEYFPQVRDSEVARVPTVADVAAALGGAAVTPVTVPRDCVDGFLAAYWCRPEVYLDRSARAAISMFARLPDDAVASGLRQLDRDLASGAWQDRHADLLELDELDAGYRLLVAS